jgi:drug/metabolite transporter (DMT)-like permease
MRKSQYSKYILLVSVVNSIGTILYSYTYVLNAVLTPLIVETEVFFVLVLAYFLLKERFKIIQILGALIVVSAVFFFLLV